MANSYAINSFLIRVLKGEIDRMILQAPDDDHLDFFRRIYKLRLLSKFLALLQVYPSTVCYYDWSGSSASVSIHNSTSLINKYEPFFDLLAALSLAVHKRTLVMHIPWIVEYLRVGRFDKIFRFDLNFSILLGTSSHLFAYDRECEYFKKVISELTSIYRSIHSTPHRLNTSLLITTLVMEDIFKEYGIDPYFIAAVKNQPIQETTSDTNSQGSSPGSTEPYEPRSLRSSASIKRKVCDY